MLSPLAVRSAAHAYLKENWQKHNLQPTIFVWEDKDAQRSVNDVLKDSERLIRLAHTARTCGSDVELTYISHSFPEGTFQVAHTLVFNSILDLAQFTGYGWTRRIQENTKETP